jgi:uncharacterized lipoprotein YmbA
VTGHRWLWFTVLLAGCSILPEPKAVHYRYLVLEATTPMPGPRRAAGTTVELRGVDAVVTRVDANEIGFSHDELWGEPLATALPRILALDLGSRLAADGVDLEPAGSQADARIDVAIQRFERGTAGRAEVWARWSVRDRARHGDITRGEVHLVDEERGPVAIGLSRLLGKLGDAIAADVRERDDRAATLPGSGESALRRPRAEPW